MKGLVISRDSQLCAEIATQGSARVPPLDIGATRSSLRDALEQIPSGGTGLVIIDASVSDLGEPDSLERLCKQYAPACFMLVTREQQQDLLIRAMRAGVREVLQLPLVHRAFHEALDRLSEAGRMSSLREGKVLSFISCKGGSGTTFISTNFGYALATLAQKKVMLIDLNGQFGDATLYVSDQKAAMTLSDVCSQISRIDGAFLDSCLVHVSNGYGILAAADDQSQSSALKPEHMDTVLRVARQHYDYILLDVGRQIDALSLRALDNADETYPVLQLALPDMRDGRRLIDIFRSLGYPAERTHLIVNRYEKGGRLRLDDMQKAVGAEVLHTVPNDYAVVIDSINQGVPVLQLARSSAAARSLAELVETVTARPVAQEQRGLLGRLFGRVAAINE
ncbi:CpaE family protein [Pseudoduganella sp. GCM10020061]|uniref:AAA family ATPase n=1 Tax=Pseudoduganella sp. GCM10020061 TaxID=3317345 RepID=UPI003632C337